MKPQIPKATAYYRDHASDPAFLRERRRYSRLYRETHPPSDKHALLLRALQAGCALCGERARECLVLWRPGVDQEPLTLRRAMVKAMSVEGFEAALRDAVCLCLNCERKYRHGRIGLPHWVPEALRWR